MPGSGRSRESTSDHHRRSVGVPRAEIHWEEYEAKGGLETTGHLLDFVTDSCSKSMTCSRLFYSNLFSHVGVQCRRQRHWVLAGRGGTAAVIRWIWERLALRSGNWRWLSEWKRKKLSNFRFLKSHVTSCPEYLFFCGDFFFRFFRSSNALLRDFSSVRICWRSTKFWRRMWWRMTTASKTWTRMPTS